MRVLLAADEPRVAAAIAKGLRRHGAAVDVAPDGADALFHTRVHRCSRSRQAEWSVEIVRLRLTTSTDPCG